MRKRNALIVLHIFLFLTKPKLITEKEDKTLFRVCIHVCAYYNVY